MAQNNLNRILVTGGAGFVGANLVRVLLEQGLSVTVLDNFSAGNRSYIGDLDLEIVEGDILDQEFVNRVTAGHDGIVHLAAQTGVPGSLKDPYHDCNVNVIGTLNMLEAARQHNVKRFIFASSNAPLGKQPPPATEDKAPLPISPYGASKLAGEGYCLAYHGSWGLGTVVLRFANLYGPYSGHKNSVVAKFIKDIARKGQITIEGDGQQTRDFIFVNDLCNAIVSALWTQSGGEIFQVASGTETSIQTLASLIQKITARTVKVDYLQSRQGDIQKNYSTIEKINQRLGWYPQIALSTGLKDTWRWFQANYS